MNVSVVVAVSCVVWLQVCMFPISSGGRSETGEVSRQAYVPNPDLACAIQIKTLSGLLTVCSVQQSLRAGNIQTPMSHAQDCHGGLVCNVGSSGHACLTAASRSPRAKSPVDVRTLVYIQVRRSQALQRQLQLCR